MSSSQSGMMTETPGPNIWDWPQNLKLYWSLLIQAFLIYIKKRYRDNLIFTY